MTFYHYSTSVIFMFVDWDTEDFVCTCSLIGVINDLGIKILV
jgi:hypothetical protein